jgi:hypothetical protein
MAAKISAMAAAFAVRMRFALLCCLIEAMSSEPGP